MSFSVSSLSLTHTTSNLSHSVGLGMVLSSNISTTPTYLSKSSLHPSYLDKQMPIKAKQRAYTLSISILLAPLPRRNTRTGPHYRRPDRSRHMTRYTHAPCHMTSFPPPPPYPSNLCNHSNATRCILEPKRNYSRTQTANRTFNRTLPMPTTPSRSAKPFPVPNAVPSYWRKAVASIDNHRSTETLPVTSDVVIIGAGYVGASIAHHLIEESGGCGGAVPSIVILEAREACSGATGRNGMSYISFSLLFCLGII